MRCFAPVVVRGEEDKGVRLWAFGKQLYQSLLNYMLDEDYGDITDVSEGNDIRVNCFKAPGKMWATTEVRPRPKSTPLSESSDQIQKWVEHFPKTLGSLKQMYSHLMNGSNHILILVLIFAIFFQKFETIKQFSCCSKRTIC